MKPISPQTSHQPTPKASNSEKPLYIALGVITLVVIAGGIYSFITINSLSKRVDALTTNITLLDVKLASTTNELSNNVEKIHTSLANTLTSTEQSVGAIRDQLGGFQNQVGSLSGSLTNLQKLAQTDPELLKKYSKVYFLNENYVPTRLAQIPLDYQYSNSKQLLFQTDALPHLLAMIHDAATGSNVKLYVDSAYRSFAEQKALKTDYKMTYGAGTANSFSADQGYSEHQLGTAVDMTTSGLGGNLDNSFDGTPAYQWMVQNAYKYGFELSYPKNNGYYVYEPWHWRFVGVKLATYLHDNAIKFYDLDQRTIDTYLINIFDQN